MREALRDLLRNRELLYMITWREIRIRYKQSVMGLLWAVLMPIIITSAGVVVRLAASRVSGQPVTCPISLAIAVRPCRGRFFPFPRSVLELQPDSEQQSRHQDQVPPPDLSRVVGPDLALRYGVALP